MQSTYYDEHEISSLNDKIQSRFIRNVYKPPKTPSQIPNSSELLMDSYMASEESLPPQTRQSIDPQFLLPSTSPTWPITPPSYTLPSSLPLSDVPPTTILTNSDKSEKVPPNSLRRGTYSDGGVPCCCATPSPSSASPQTVYLGIIIVLMIIILCLLKKVFLGGI